MHMRMIITDDVDNDVNGSGQLNLHIAYKVLLIIIGSGRQFRLPTRMPSKWCFKTVEGYR